MCDALISIKPKFVDKILLGEKTVEIRRRRVNISSGSRLWIYSTLPVGCIQAVAFIDHVETLSQEEIWNKYKSKVGISKDEYITYTSGSNAVTAIVLSRVEEISPAPTLTWLKSMVHGFSPPQFFMKIETDDKLMALLKEFSSVGNEMRLTC